MTLAYSPNNAVSNDDHHAYRVGSRELTTAVVAKGIMLAGGTWIQAFRITTYHLAAPRLGQSRACKVASMSVIQQIQLSSVILSIDPATGAAYLMRGLAACNVSCQMLLPTQFQAK